MNLNNFALQIYVSISFCFSKLRKQFFLFFLFFPIFLIKLISLHIYKIIFPKFAALSLINPRCRTTTFYTAKSIPFEVFWLLVSNNPAFLLITICYSVLVILALFVWPLFISFSSRNFYFRNIRRVFWNSSDCNNINCCYVYINLNNLHWNALEKNNFAFNQLVNLLKDGDLW